VSVLRGLEPSPPYLARVADRLRQVTVEVRAPGGGGAGVLWASDLIVTNAHVARSGRLGIGLADGRNVDAEVIAADRRADLALLRMPRHGVPRAALGDSDALRIGAVVVALGHPLGLRGMLTAGIVHAVASLSPGGRHWIHADVRLARGNSGGPLADTAGDVVGINTMIAGGLALAIPINDVRRFVGAALASAT
jgi:serine protease Do